MIGDCPENGITLLKEKVCNVLLHQGVRNPLPSSMHNFYVLIETTGSDESYDREKLEAFLLRSMEGGLISDGVLAQDINQALSFWRIREVLLLYMFLCIDKSFFNYWESTISE
ncbi:hypothetical protein CsSME_00003359 [Camellia sinensis var. sinensis]